MIALFALIMPVAYAGNEGEAVVTAVGGLASLPFVLRLRRPALGVALLGALAVWAAVSFAWSPLAPTLASVHRYKDLEALTAPKLLAQAVLDTAFVYGALRLPPDQRDRALWLTAALLVVVAAVLVVEGVEGGRLYGALNGLTRKPLRPDLARRDAARGCYAVVLLFWPLALATWRRVSAAAPVLVGMAVAVSALMLGVDAPAAAMLVSLAVFAAVRTAPRTAIWIGVAAVAVYFLAAPAVFLPHGHTAADLPAELGKESWHIRIGIWRFASGLIAHRPWLGYGLDASRTFPDRIPMHPHDAAIQLWLETGVLGAVLAALFWGWLLLRIRTLGRGDAPWTAAACATASVYLLIGAISFGIWQEWWLSLGAIAVACCGMTLARRRETAVTEASGGLTPLDA